MKSQQVGDQPAKSEQGGRLDYKVPKGHMGEVDVFY